jgi:hypothetical protein
MVNRLLLTSFALAALLVANPSQAGPARPENPAIFVDEEYDRYRKQGDEFFAKGEYERAKGRYENCLEVPGFAQDAYAKNRLELINRLLVLRKQAADALDEARPATGGCSKEQRQAGHGTLPANSGRQSERSRDERIYDGLLE